MLRKSLLLAALAALLSLLFNCSNPVDEPLRWTSVVEIPVTNQKFNLKEQFDDMFEYTDSMKVFDPDSTKIGDTLLYMKSSIDTVNFEQSEDNIDTQTYQSVLGPIPLTTTATFGDTVALPANAGNFSANFPLALDKVYEITFYDTTVNMLSIRVDNISSSALSNVTIAITGVDTQTVLSIPANSSEIVGLSLRKKTLLQTVPFSVSGAAGTAGAKQLGVSFSLNGLLVSKCKVDDHLVNFNRVFYGNYKITDTISMDYIDISNGNFQYTINNYSGLKFRVLIEHLNLWQEYYCARNHLESLADIDKSKQLDSLLYSGYITERDFTQGLMVLPFSSYTPNNDHINGTRLFTLWDTIKKITYTSIKYSVASDVPKGDTLTLSATDSLSFSVGVKNLKFKEFLGTVMVPYERKGDTQKVAITFPKPWNESIRDSLRGNVAFKDVNGYIRAKTEMPPKSFIDTMAVDFKVSAQNYAQIKDSTTTKFVNVIKDSIFNRTVNITNVTNQFPDTVIINTTVRIPKGTRMRVCNNLTTDNPEYDNYIGKMIVNILTNYDLTPKLDWTVADTSNLDLGSNTFPIDKPFRFVKKLDKRRALMNLKIFNSSNLNMYLFSLIAPKSRIHTLDSMSTNDFFKLLSNKDAAEKQGYVNFLSTKGVYIPKRSLKDTSDIELTHDQLDTIVSSDTCSWRWAAKFVPQGQDAMSDTDFVEIHSKLRVEGVNSTDSLTIW